MDDSKVDAAAKALTPAQRRDLATMCARPARSTTWFRNDTPDPGMVAAVVAGALRRRLLCDKNWMGRWEPTPLGRAVAARLTAPQDTEDRE